MLLQLLVGKMLLILKRFALVARRFLFRVLENVLDFLAGEPDRSARDVERQEKVEGYTAFPPGVRDVVYGAWTWEDRAGVRAAVVDGRGSDGVWVGGG